MLSACLPCLANVISSTGLAGSVDTFLSSGIMVMLGSIVDFSSPIITWYFIVYVSV